MDAESFREAMAPFRGVFLTSEELKLTDEELQKYTAEELCEMVETRAFDIYQKKEQEFTSPIMREVERVVLLRNVDQEWMDHIDAMDDLKQGIHLRAYAQRDPVVEFRLQSYDMFDEMTAAIRENTVRMLLTLVPRRREDVERKAVAKVTATSAGGDDTATHTTVRKGKKVGPNDPCPCGSGKKYKKCCGAPGKEKPTQE